jgi:peptidoglycan hydrolase-like protein with peptidoglycan-binding domain
MLARGSTGKLVEGLQKLLAARGINPGTIDGVFGPKTESAVKRFQEKAGLNADGIAGPKTMAALEAKAPAATAPKLVTPKPIVAATKPVSPKAAAKPKTAR